MGHGVEQTPQGPSQDEAKPEWTIRQTCSPMFTGSMFASPMFTSPMFTGSMFAHHGADPSLSMPAWWPCSDSGQCTEPRAGKAGPADELNVETLGMDPPLLLVWQHSRPTCCCGTGLSRLLWMPPRQPQRGQVHGAPIV